MDILVKTITTQLDQSEVYDYHRDVLVAKMRRVNELGQTNMIHQIVMNQFGYTVYEPTECLAFIIQSLRLSGLHVTYLGNNSLFVAWAQNEPTHSVKKTPSPLSTDLMHTLNRTHTRQPGSIMKPQQALGTVTNDAAVRKLAFETIKKQVRFKK